ncbi:TasA family protein [Alicyclobacillus dauci]|uniref:CalY family protein n=1 Tax=Alicyclobacillus dauci TaxID=1475485 RepID=A0ABY6Z1R2_9BACL|nr:TasA family protein [Alicyclobacillus dauci]WAH36766.1 CalY family protein [Alicyclobacillus dauci]
MKHKGKLSLTAATALAGIALMSTGSFAIFTANAATSTNTFAAGVVDLTANDSGAAAKSNGQDILLQNLVPGDTTADTQYVYNKGTVTEFVSVATNANGDIFFDDGLNNPSARDASDAILPEFTPARGLHTYDSNSTVDGTANGISNNNPVLSSPSISGDDYLSVDYSKTNNNSAFQHDNNPFQYTVNVQVQSSSDGGKTWSAAGQFTTEDGTVIPNLNDTSSWNVWYQQAGTSPSGSPYSASTASYSPTTQYSGSTKVFGIVLPPQQIKESDSTHTNTLEYRLAVTYNGTLPTDAHNDYQQTVGGMQSEFDAWQWENSSASPVGQPDINDVSSDPLNPSSNPGGPGQTEGTPAKGELTAVTGQQCANPELTSENGHYHLSGVQANQSYTFTGKLEDSSGNPVSGSGVTMTATEIGTANGHITNIQVNSDGTFTFTYRSDGVGFINSKTNDDFTLNVGSNQMFEFDTNNYLNKMLNNNAVNNSVN